MQRLSTVTQTLRLAAERLDFLEGKVVALEPRASPSKERSSEDLDRKCIGDSNLLQLTYQGPQQGHWPPSEMAR